MDVICFGFRYLLHRSHRIVVVVVGHLDRRLVLDNQQVDYILDTDLLAVGSLLVAVDRDNRLLVVVDRGNHLDSPRKRKINVRFEYA